jgi:hypothetical protein
VPHRFDRPVRDPCRAERDLAPAANGYMFTRGFTWAPGVGKRPYP